MAGRLAGKVAIVTGGAQGIGRAFALRFASEGAQVAVADLNSEKAQAVAAEIQALGGESMSVAVDVADDESARAMAQEVSARFGRIDALVNNASIFSTIRMGPFEEITPQEWRALIEVNLTGSFFCCQAVAPALRAAGGGAIVNISSGTVLMGRAGYAHYVTSKAGIIGMTRALANELGGDGVRVNSIMPGSVETEVPRDTVTPEQAKAIVSRQALARRLRPEDIVGTAVFLASDEAALMTGQSLVVDGGVVFQ
jgi:3-oxoacyl-[acyl-carrier protein] reductase